MNGMRLRTAREACWMTQSELAAQAGIPTSTISKMERDIYGNASDDYVDTLADALDIPVSFLSNAPLPDVPDGRYRKQSKASAKLQKSVVAHARQVASVMQDADAHYRIHKTTLVPMERGENLDDSEGISRRLRNMLGLSIEGPVGNMTRACERAGVVVADMSPVGPGGQTEGERRFSAFSAWPDMGMGDSRPVIIVSSYLSGDILRATIAHEVAHIYAHTRNPAIPDAIAERQAWMIGGELMIPVKEAREILGGRQVTLDRLRRMKAAYGVSVKFLITYCEHRHIITRERAVALNKQYSSRKWHQGEPVEVVKERAQLFPSVIRRMMNDGLDIGMSRSDVTSIVWGGGNARARLTLV